MDITDGPCKHLSQIEDHHEGTIVCISCGLVLSSLFLEQVESVTQISEKENKYLTEIQNLLDKIHVPICYGYQIESYLCKNFTIKSRQALVFSIYNVLNKLDIPISLQEVSNAMSIKKKLLNRVKCDYNCVTLDSINQVDKYGGMLGLPYNTVALIKRKLSSVPVSGHNPNSVIASLIYQVCKKSKLKLSLKRVSEITSISCISIQRYNNFYNHVYGSQGR